jgi:DNA-binding GntR family transcriptional regulator
LFIVTDDVDEHEADASDAGAVMAARKELAAGIRRGDYLPNQRLVETELSATLGISRATLRSVFVLLEQENYISLERHRGARVKQFSPDEAIEILRVREVLEAAAAGLAAERITPAECDQLERIIGEMVAADAAKDGVAYSAWYGEFHALIIAAARTPTLARFISSTPYPLVMSQYRNLETPHPRVGSLNEHLAILANLRTGNGAASTEAMRFHVASARRALTLRAQADLSAAEAKTDWDQVL